MTAKILFLLTIYVSILPFASSQESTPTNFPVPNTILNSVNDLESERRNISMTDENGNITYKSQQDIEEEYEDVVRLFKAKKYAEVYPIVSELAQWGIKDAQAILGSMYLKGEHVDKSTERGLLWLGVAKEDPLQKNAASSFEYVYKQLSEEHRTYIDQKVAEHIEKFGSEAQHITCKKESEVGSNIQVTKCTKEVGSNSILHAIQ